MTMLSGAGYSGNKIPSGYKQAQIQNYTPEQMDLFSQNFSHVGPNSYLSRLASGDQSAFQDIEAPAMKQFSGLQGQLASRFSGQGMGARGSSGFQNTTNQAASDFAQQLKAQRHGLQMEAITGLRDFSSMLLGQQPYEQQLVQKRYKQPSFWEQLALQGASGFGQGAGNTLTSWATGGF